MRPRRWSSQRAPRSIPKPCEPSSRNALLISGETRRLKSLLGRFVFRGWSGNIRHHGRNQRFRQRGIRNHPRQYDSANHLREDSRGMSAANGPWVRGRQFCNLVEIALNRRDEDGAESGIVAPRGVYGQCWQNAPGPWIVTVSRRHIAFDKRAKRILGLLSQSILQQRRRVGDGTFAGLDRQFVLRSEVAVEAAMSKPGRFHDIGNADPFEAMLAQQARRSLDDLLAVLQRL